MRTAADVWLITGIPGASRLVYTGAGHLLVGADCDLVRLTDLVFDGANRPLAEYVPGTVHLIGVADTVIAGCQFLGSARYLWADDSLQSDPSTVPDTLRESNSVDNVTEYGADIGGPIVADRLWFYAAYSNNNISNIISSWNYPQETELTNWTAKLNAQPWTNNNASLYYMFSDKTVNARDLSATRPPETARKQSGPGWTLKLEDTHLFSNSLVMNAVGSHVDSGYLQEPLGGMDIEPYWIGSAGLPQARGRSFRGRFRWREPARRRHWRSSTDRPRRLASGSDLSARRGRR